MTFQSLRQIWLFNTRNDVLAGLVVALALIPEAIAFSIIAGVDPKVGLYASFCIAVVIAVVGGRPGSRTRTGGMAGQERVATSLPSQVDCLPATQGCASLTTSVPTSAHVCRAHNTHALANAGQRAQGDHTRETRNQKQEGAGCT